MHDLSLQISISSTIQIVGLSIPLSLGNVTLSRGRRFVSSRFPGAFLVLFSLHISILRSGGVNNCSGCSFC
jgi:hypothetical protein